MTKAQIMLPVQVRLPSMVECHTRHIITKTQLNILCLVFGPPNEAATGELLVACAGPAPAVSSVLPLLTGVVARRTIDLSGQEPAKASLLKLISNTVAGNMIEATAEAMVLAEKTGLGAANLESLIKELWPGPCAYYAQRMAAGVYADGKVSLSINVQIRGVVKPQAIIQLGQWCRG